MVDEMFLDAIEHRPLAEEISRFNQIENPTEAQIQQHALMLVTKSLNGSEVLVLCSKTNTEPVPLVLNFGMGDYGMAVTSMEHAMSKEHIVSKVGGDIDAESICYVQKSAREFIVSQFQNGHAGIVLNQGTDTMRHSGHVNFEEIGPLLMANFIKQDAHDAVLPEALLTMLALEDDKDQCQEIGREFLTNPNIEIWNYSVMIINPVRLDDHELPMMSQDKDGNVIANIHSSMAQARAWLSSQLSAEVFLDKERFQYGFQMYPLGELIKSLIIVGECNKKFVLDEKITIDYLLANEVVRSRQQH